MYITVLVMPNTNPNTVYCGCNAIIMFQLYGIHANASPLCYALLLLLIQVVPEPHSPLWSCAWTESGSISRGLQCTLCGNTSTQGRV